MMEKCLKESTGRLYEQKAQLVVGQVIVNSIVLFALPFAISDPPTRYLHSPWQRGFFAGWDYRVFICLAVWIPAGWTATLLVKERSNLLKTVAQSVASVLTYVFSMVPLTLVGPPLVPQQVSMPVVSLALTVMFAAISFGMDSTRPVGKSRENREIITSPSNCYKVDDQFKWVGAYKGKQWCQKGAGD